MTQPCGIRLVFARVVSLLLLPAGLLCVGVPFYLLTLPDRWGMIEDTRAAFGAGRDSGPLKTVYVDCVKERSGSNSSRGIGITEYACVIDLSEEPEAAPATTSNQTAKPADKGRDPYAGLSYQEAVKKYDEAMEEWNAATAEQDRQNRAALDAYIAQSKARNDVSNRIERTLATDHSGELPAVRILSAPGEPRRVGLFWGFGEIVWRWVHWLVISLVFFGFGGACLYAVWLAWRRYPKNAEVGCTL